MFPMLGGAANRRADFKNVTCVDIADPGSNGSPAFIVSLVRRGQDRQGPDYDKFEVTVKKQVSLNSSHTYERIGTYTAIVWESPNTQAPYHLQFDTGHIREFELGLYRTSSLPWADLRMIANSGSNQSEEITKQLECSIK
ncbi:hypothetical protein DVV40_10065 [Lactobacillus acidophilus]|nr:hypothetical protein [Lactobacillus acidophilus]